MSVAALISQRLFRRCAPRHNTIVMPVVARFCFLGETNDFLDAEHRHKIFEGSAGTTDTLKHVIESLGVPHTEIGKVLVNGLQRPLSDRVANHDSIEVHPHALPIILENPRFILDGHLGRLAAYLRMLGFDTWYERSPDDETLAAISSHEKRFLMTRDVGLLKRREVERGYCVRSHKPQDQLREIATRLSLRSQLRAFSRCMACNGLLQAVAKQDVLDALPPHTRETKYEFSRCSHCAKVYWRGSHFERMSGWIDDLSEFKPAAIRAAGP